MKADLRISVKDYSRNKNQFFASLLQVSDNLRSGLWSNCSYENAPRLLTKQLRPSSHPLDGNRRAPVGAWKQLQTPHAAGVARLSAQRDLALHPDSSQRTRGDKNWRNIAAHRMIRSSCASWTSS